MGCILSCLVCNAASCVASGICQCCGKAIPMAHVAGRVMYTIVFFIMAFLAWIFRAWAEQILGKVPILSEQCKELKEFDGGLCYGVFAVYRVSFAFAIFHCLLALIMIGVSRKSDPRTTIQDGWWGVKLLLLLAGIVGSFFIPNAFFNYFGYIALVAAALFVIVQLLLLVDFAHSWAENWIGKYEESEEGDKTWWFILLGSTGLMYSFAIAISIVMGVFFMGSACPENVAFLVMNIVFCFLLSMLSIHPKVQEANPRSGLLQAGLVCAYTTYLVWSSMMSGGCNPWGITSNGSSVGMNVSVLIGAIFTIVAVCYTTIRAANTVGSIDMQQVEPLLKEEAGEKEKDEEKDSESTANPDEPVGYNYSRFHAIFALGALYLAMLMTDWIYKPDVLSQDWSSGTVDQGEGAVWVKAVSSWVCVALYLWTLVAPVCLPDREWGTSS